MTRTPPAGDAGQSNPNRRAEVVTWRQICGHCENSYDYGVPVTDVKHPTPEVHQFLRDSGWTDSLGVPLICPKCSAPPAQQATGGVGTVIDGVLTLDYSDEATRQRALELAVQWTERHTTPTGVADIVTIAETFRQYLANGATTAPDPGDPRRSLYLIPARGWLVEYLPRIREGNGGDPNPWIIYGRTPTAYAVIGRQAEQPDGCVELVPVTDVHIDRHITDAVRSVLDE